MKKETLQKIESIVGKENFLTDKEDLLVYSYDGTPLFEQLPEAVVFPETTEQISKLVKLANEEKFSIVPRGAGTGLSGGSIPVENSIALVMTKWDKIIEIDAANMTATVQAGVVTSKLQDEVEKLKLFYPPDPGSRTVCTIAGNVAENAGGLRGLKYGVTRDYIMGMEMVMPNGEVLRSGGKNVKDVAGYDLKQIVIGSEGTLGIITEVTLKLIPMPNKFHTMVGYFDTLRDAGQAVSDIIAAHVIPCMMEFLDNTTINCVEDYTNIGLPRDTAAILLIEVDGKGSIVDDEADTVVEILKKNNASFVKKAESPEDADDLKTARRTAFSALARRKPTTILEDATVPRSALPEMIEICKKVADKYKLEFGNFGHAGDGNLHPTCLCDERDADELERAHKAFEEIFDAAISFGGTITGEHGTGLSKKPFLERSAGVEGVEMMKAIKSALDPNNVINPGKIFTNKPKNVGFLPETREQIPDFDAYKEKYTK